MKHIERYHEFNNQEQLNEGLIKNIIMFPFMALLSVLGFGLLQIVHPKHARKAITDIIDTYYNLPKLIQILEKLLNSRSHDLTDAERKKIREGLDGLHKARAKNPTIDDLKKKLLKYRFLNFRNSEWIKKSILEYEPRDLTVDELTKKVKKAYKDVSRYDVKQMTTRPPDIPQEDWDDMM